MSLAGCQINPIYVNFYLHKSLKFFDKNSTAKVSPLMPIRVKPQICKKFFSIIRTTGQNNFRNKIPLFCDFFFTFIRNSWSICQNQCKYKNLSNHLERSTILALIHVVLWLHIYLQLEFNTCYCYMRAIVFHQ